MFRLKWIFPLISQEGSESVAIVEEAEEEDLAKFEVLMAYLSLQVKKVELYQEVKELAIRDSLTEVFVRRHFMERFEEELRRSQKFDLPSNRGYMNYRRSTIYNSICGRSLQSIDLVGQVLLPHIYLL